LTSPRPDSLKPDGEHERIMALLADGKPHHHYEVEKPDTARILQYQRALSDLRKRGYAVSFVLEGPDGERDCYRWLTRDDRDEVDRLYARGLTPRFFFGDGVQEIVTPDVVPHRPRSRRPARPASSGMASFGVAQGRRARDAQGVLF